MAACSPPVSRRRSRCSSPWPSRVSLGFAILWRWPVLAVYLLVFGALFIDQWPVQGLHPFTTQTQLFETLSGFTPLPIPITPAEMILGVALLALSSPRSPGVWRGFIAAASSCR